MLRFVIGALGACLAASGCSGSVRAQEGHACSTNPDDDPQYVCTPAQDLVCIHTYSVVVTNQNEAKKFDGGVRPVYVCRWACNVTAECPQQGDICCRGTIHGKTYNKMGGCVPPGKCETDGEEEPDGGAPPDATTAIDTAKPPTDGAGADTAAADAPVAPDAPATDDVGAGDTAAGS